MLGQVELDNFIFEDSALGVYDTSQLKGLLSVVDDDIELSTQKLGDRVISLGIKNGSVSLNYSLSDTAVIPAAPNLKHIPDFETEVVLDSAFIEKFVRGKNALPETEKFTILQDKQGVVNVVIGHSKTNTNNVKIAVKTNKCGLETTSTPLSFNANFFKEILLANKECSSAVLEVSNDGLARVNFKVDEFNSTYYLVQAQDVD